jgi:cytokinin dehydrogenase
MPITTTPVRTIPTAAPADDDQRKSSLLRSGVSRRNVLKGAAIGAAIVGWDASSRTWVSDVEAAGHRLHEPVPIPDLLGTLVRDDTALASFGSDFGKLVTSSPFAILRTGSVDDIVAMVRYARTNGIGISMNGQAGPIDQRESHSNFGQAGVDGGISIDASMLATIHQVDTTSATVDAGVTWAELSVAALQVGATPPMLTDYLRLSVGGTLSVGGFGGTVQRVGTQVDNVIELEVVTGRGDLVTCSRTSKPWIFYAALAGAGQCAIITKATLNMVPAPNHVRFLRLFYNDAATFSADQLTLLYDGRFDFQEGQIVRRPDDSGWWFSIDVATYSLEPITSDSTTLLEGMSDVRDSLQVLDIPYAQWIFRLEPTVETLRTNGFWGEPKPWLSVLVPAEEAVRFLEVVTSELTSTDLGAGLAGIYPIDTTKIVAPLVETPDGRAAFQLNLLRFPFPGTSPDAIAGQLAQNRRLYDAAVGLGGTRYIIGAIPDMSRSDWRRHYGREFWAFKLAKRILDPDRVLTPGQGIFS